MSGATLSLPVALPLVAAALLVAMPRRRHLHLVTGIAVTTAICALGGATLAVTLGGTVLTQDIGGWPAGFAITLAADPFSALMLTVSALAVLASLAYAALAGADTLLFTPLALILSAGAYGAFLTADLFNLFVFIEVMLAPSYALLTMTGSGGRAPAGRIYVTVSLLASTIFLAGVALVYSVTGTVNLGELAGAARHGTAAPLACSVILLALAAKAAVTPLHGWLPRTYPFAPAPVVVLFSGVLTKVGVYAIIRIYAVVFAGAPQYRGVVLVMAIATMIIGVLGAVGEQTMREILIFDMVSQIGYILLGLALFTTAGLAAAIYYLVQYVLVQAALLIGAAVVETRHGGGRLGSPRGLAHRDPLLAAAFLIPAFSLAGLPPLSGFIAKLALIQAAAARASYVAAAVAVAVSFLTLLAMVKIWRGVFAGRESAATARPRGRPHTLRAARPALLAPGLVLTAGSIVLGIWAQPLLTATTTAAAGLTNTASYVRAVR